MAGWAGLLAAVALGVCLPISAQSAASQGASSVSPEFQRPATPLIVQRVDRTQRTPTLGAVHPETAISRDLGRAPQSLPLEHIQLILRRSPERQAAFDAEVEALHTPHSPSFHHWLTPEDIGANFSPAPSDIAAIRGYLEAEGFTVNFTGKAGMIVDFTGTVAQVENSFHTSIHNFLTPSGEIRYSAAVPASLPSALAPAVVGFVSLSNFPPHSQMQKLVKPLPGVEGPPRQSGVQANGQPLYTTGGNYYVGPQDFYTIYNEKPLLAASINGTGQTVALLEEVDITTADVTNFRTTFNVLPNTPALTVMHGAGAVTCTDPSTKNTSEEGEAVLDTEWAGAVAPSATLLYMSCKTATTGGIFLSAEAVIDNNLATSMSLSYGSPEYYEGTSEASTNTFVTNLWEQAAAEGETVVVSAGDSGSAQYPDQNTSTPVKYGIHSNVYGSSDYNVSAGGTDFQDYYNEMEGDAAYNRAHYWSTTNATGDSSALSYVAETTWNSTCASSILDVLEGAATSTAECDKGSYVAPAGGSGGVSVFNARPSWQMNTVYGMPAASGIYNFRLVPDVSLFAASGFYGHALPYYQSDVKKALQYAGGTSFVAPQLAGVFALVAQQTSERVGQPDYVLYSMGGVEYGTTTFTAGTTCNGSGTTSNTGTTSSVPAGTCIFNDIVTSNNSQACTTGDPNCYSDGNATYGILSITNTSVGSWQAGQGYDMATGLGSLNLNNLVTNWQVAASGGTLYTPTVSITASSTAYTYGSPSQMTYSATVSGPGSFPTGSVAFSGAPTIGSIGTQGLVASSGCSTGATCTEATGNQAYTPPATLSAGSYVITGNYNSTNENYAAGSGTAALTVNQQAPTVTVPNVTSTSAPTTLTATVAYVGAGVAPSGVMSFAVDSGTAVAGTCSGSSSPLTCSVSYDTRGLANGPHTITATIAADTNYTAASNTGTLNYSTVAPTITWSPSSSKGFLGVPVGAGVLDATSNSGGAVTYTATNASNVTTGITSSSTLAVGAYMLTANVAANGAYGAGSATVAFTAIYQEAFVANSGGNVTSAYDNGTAQTANVSGGGLGAAVDASGYVWSVNAGGAGVSSFTDTGTLGANYAASGLTSGTSLAIDGAGVVWIAQGGTKNNVFALTNAGAVVSTTGLTTAGNISTPASVSVDTAGSLWIANTGNNTVTEVIGAATPIATPTVTQTISATPGAKP